MSTKDICAEDHAAINILGKRHHFSPASVTVMWQALQRGNGRLAQFSHPEFGGAGQWMQGGMIMLGDMFDQQLKSRVGSLCADLATLMASRPTTASGVASKPHHDEWWPAGLSHPDIAGSQNALRYAYFADARRLVIDKHGKITTYDTQDHHISGVSQQQSGSGSLAFTSQYGVVDVARLPAV